MRFANYRGYPTSLEIPVGAYNEQTGEWEHIAIARWDGARFAYAVSGFHSTHDANMARDDVLIFWVHRGDAPIARSPTSNDRRASSGPCAGSSVQLVSGSVGQSSGDGAGTGGVRRRGESQGVSLSYESEQSAGGTGGGGGAPNYGVVGGIRTTRAASKIVGAQCMSRGAADQILSGDPNACSGGSCGAAGAASPPDLNLLRLQRGAASQEAWTPASPEREIPYDVTQPDNGGGAMPSAGWVQGMLSITTSRGGGCGRSGSASFGGNGAGGGTSMDVPTSPTQPLAEVPTSTFTPHRHGSPAGSGWGVSGVDRVYANPAGGELAMLTGTGHAEHFGPRPRNTLFTSFAGLTRAYGRDPVTNQLVEALADGSIHFVDPQTHAETPLFTGLSLGSPQALAVVYVNGARHVVVASDTQLTDVNAAGSARVLTTRTPAVNTSFIVQVPGVAGRDGWLFYTSGLEADPGFVPDRVLYRFDLTQANPPAEPLTMLTGGDIALDPKGELSTLQLGAPHGLAMSHTGSLYVADRQRDAVYEVRPNASGLIAPDSRLVRVVGTGSSQSATELGAHTAARRFPVNQPALLSTAPDGTLWIGSPFGFATFDPAAGEVAWVTIDGSVRGSEQLHQVLRASSQRVTMSALSATSVLYRAGDAGLGNNVIRTDVDLLASDTDPTRTVTRTPGGWMLTDTTQDVVEAFDAAGRLIERRSRAGDPLQAIAYVDAQSDRVDRILDPTGSYTQFAYAGGKLQSITDAAGRTTQYTVDARGDLVEVVHPTGERWRYEYSAHRMTKKVSPRGDETTYTYRADGSLETATRPNGETFTLTASIAQPPHRDAGGRLVRDGFYVDARGVRHDFLLHNTSGWILRDAFTADGTTYAVEHQLGVLGDPNAAAPAQLRNDIGRITSTSVNGLVIGPETRFDTLGRPAAVLANTVSNLVLESYTFASDGRLASLFRGPSNADFGIERDAQGRVTRVFDRAGGTIPTGRETRFTYLPSGLVDTMTDHGVTTSFGYDAQQNVIATSDTLGRTSTFTHDAAGNVQTANDGATPWTFAHDAMNRLTAATDALGNTTTLAYTDTTCGCSQQSLVTAIHTPDLPPTKQWTLDYAPDGRLASIKDPDSREETYTYEATGELKTVTDRLARTTTITHDQLGRVKDILDTLGRTHRRAYPTPTAAGWASPNLLAGSGDATPPTTALTGTLRDGDHQIGENGYDAAFGRSLGQPQPSRV